MTNHSDEERLMQKVRESAFALHELVLFLDTHPRDRRAFSAYKAWQKQYETYKAEYEANFGPLCAYRVKATGYDWCARPWPWQVCAADAKGGN